MPIELSLFLLLFPYGGEDDFLLTGEWLFLYLNMHKTYI